MTNPITTSVIDAIDREFPKLRNSGRSIGRLFYNLFAKIIAIRSLVIEENRLAHDRDGTSGLNLAVFGTLAHSMAGVIVDELDQTIALTDNALNYVEYDAATGTISANTSGFTPGRLPLFKATAADGAISPTDVLDKRPIAAIINGNVVSAAFLTDAVADALPYLTISIGAEAANAITLTFQAYDAGGASLAAIVPFELWLSDGVEGWETAAAPDGGIAVGVGTLLETLTAGKRISLVTNASGQAQVTLTESTAKTWYARAMLNDGKVVTSAAVTFA